MIMCNFRATLSAFGLGFGSAQVPIPKSDTNYPSQISPKVLLSVLFLFQNHPT